ncbi:MAG TPA: HD domain-containing phosphohydrolase [Pyrinomonadaceae bacterium]|nr:HD domain-containing phosphohydrolase [Pyrinomonadaceae bacterium]
MSDRMRKVLHAFAALADLGEEIAETRDYEEMASSSLHVVLGALGIRQGAVAEYDREADAFRVIAARGFGQTLVPGALIPLSGGGRGSNHNGNGGGSGGTDPAPRAHDAPETGALGEAIRARLEGHALEVVTPMMVRGEVVGALLLGVKASGEAYTVEEAEVVRSLGRHIGVGLHNHRLLREVERRAEENMRLYDELRGLYRDTVRAFAAAIDCKDKYTQGHSERVGKYSEIIAREMGWADEQVEGIAVAGYLHDIGKLVVDRDIINSPARIDAKQSSELNRHPAAGYEILRPINHPYADIPLTARYHHERPDGRGYPEGLRGDEIPLVARVVSLADSFDAMTTDRPYRRRRTFDEVVEDLRRNAGKQFAPEVVVALCSALLKEVRGERRPRQIIKLLGKGYVDEERMIPALESLMAELEAGAPSNVAVG